MVRNGSVEDVVDRDPVDDFLWLPGVVKHMEESVKGKYTVTFNPSEESPLANEPDEVITLDSVSNVLALTVALGGLDKLRELPDRDARYAFALGVAEQFVESGGSVLRGNLLAAIVVEATFPRLGMPPASSGHDGPLSLNLIDA